MHRTLVSVFLASLALAGRGNLAPAQQLQGATPSGRLELTSTSETAKREFEQLIFEFTNLRPLFARQHAMNALAADPSFGLARVYLGFAAMNPQLTPGERAAEAARGLAALSTASAPEVLLGLYVRESAAGRGAAARPILTTLAQLVPNDAYVAFSVFQTQRAGTPRDELVRMQRDLLAKFPDYAVGYNQYAYDLHYAGQHDEEVTAIRRYAQLASTQPNPHDTWADLMVMHGRLEDAIGHARASIRVDSTWTAGHLKIGAIELARGNADSARVWFARAHAASLSPAGKVDARHWTAASYAVQRNPKMAIQELTAIAQQTVADAAPPAARALPHQRMAVIEAMIGNGKNAAAHLEHARAAGGNSLVQTWHEAIVQATLGDTAAARATAESFASATGVSAATAATLNGFVAAAARKHSAAENALAQSAPTDLLAKALRAEILKSQGKKTEAQAARAEVMSAVLKLDNNPQIDIAKLVARLRVERM